MGIRDGQNFTFGGDATMHSMTQTVRKTNGAVAVFLTASAVVLLLARPGDAQNTRPAGPQAKATHVLFMCPHGAAKSVLASAYFRRLAKERGLNVVVDSAGTEPDPAVAPAVAAHLAKQGYPVPSEKPRLVTPDDFAKADVVISLGCDLTRSPKPAGTLVKWDDVPAPSEDFAGADDAIRRHVAALVDQLAEQVKAQRR
jgi:protein-tyrosine-phosphatase